jgi:hypothetical protein
LEAATNASIKTMADQTLGIEQTTESLLERSEATRIETKAIKDAMAQSSPYVTSMSLVRDELFRLGLAKDEARLASLRTAETDALVYGDGTVLNSIRLQVEAIQKLIDAKKKVHEDEKALDAAKKFQADWKKVTDDIGQGLTDSLYRAFEAGGDFFDTFWKGVKNTIRTTVLRIVIDAVMKPVNAMLNQMLGIAFGAIFGGGGAAAGAAAGGGMKPPGGFNIAPSLPTGAGGFVSPSSAGMTRETVQMVSGPTYINIDSRTDQAQVTQLVATGVSEGNKQLVEALRARGALQ